MATRRVRRDSETSTDSWSLVEEDRIDDDFSTDNDESSVEPIIEEPPSSDDDVTASEHSNSDDDSDISDEESEISDSESEGLAEGLEEEEEEAVEEDDDVIIQAGEEEEEEEEEEESDSEISESESEISEISEDEKEELTEEEMAEARAQWEENEKFLEEEEPKTAEAHRSIRMILFLTIFTMIFPLADVFTSWMLTYRNHRFNPSKIDYSNFIFEDYGSLQNYPSNEPKIPVYDWPKEVREATTKRDSDKRIPQDNLYLLRDLLQKRIQIQKTLKSHEILEIFTNQSQNWKFQSDAAPIKRITVVAPTVPPTVLPTVIRQTTVSRWSNATCRALAPIPPAPFSPRRRHGAKTMAPRHSPCFVHVNQSKWTCQKNVPSVIYSTPRVTVPMVTVANTQITVMPRVYKKKSFGRSGDYSKKKFQFLNRTEICGKKASQSMRTNVQKPTDQCHSRNFAKFTPRRKHIAYKTPLPCQVPIYKPTFPKQSKKPSNDDWHQQRSYHRAQLRSRA